MSVEKLSGQSQVDQEPIPFTQICNDVIYNIKNGDAFLVWSYLQSKTANWKVIKQDIKNNYGFSDKKLKKIFSYLHRANLIKYVQMHCANGDFAHTDICVLNGTKFDNNQQYNDLHSGGPKRGRARLGSTANDELLNKEPTKQRKTLNTKISCASDDARTRFDEFWNIYPKKKNKIRAQKIWEKKRYDKIATLICEDVTNRIINEHQWQDLRYVPHPETYLNDDRWTDDITMKNIGKQPVKSSAFSEFMNSSKSEGGTYDELGDAINYFS